MYQRLLLVLLWLGLGSVSLRAIDSLGRVPSDELFRAELQARGIHLSSHNRLVLLPNGHDKFADLFEHIRKARHHVHLEYFNFRNDSISARLFRLLAERASQGVEVRALFDAFGNMSNNRPLGNRMLDSLRSKGIQIYKFDPINFPWINHVWSRDHRKIVVIDGAVGYLGGMNIADYYIEGKPKIGQWRDMHCRIEGEAVHDLQHIFVDMWARTTGETLDAPAYYPRIEPSDEQRLAVVDRLPSESPRTLREVYAHAIDEADSVVRIVNPYFVPTRVIMRSLRNAIKRGVRVEIMASDKSDIPFTPDAMLYKLRRLGKLGAQVYLYQGGFHHSKVMTIDGRMGTLGSMNLNSRSLRYDYETNVFFFDTGITAQLDSIYYEDQASSIPLDDAYWQKRSIWKRFVGWFANLFTPIL